MVKDFQVVAGLWPLSLNAQVGTQCCFDGNLLIEGFISFFHWPKKEKNVDDLAIHNLYVSLVRFDTLSPVSLGLGELLYRLTDELSCSKLYCHVKNENWSESPHVAYSHFFFYVSCNLYKYIMLLNIQDRAHSNIHTHRHTLTQTHTHTHTHTCTHTHTYEQHFLTSVK